MKVIKYIVILLIPVFLSSCKDNSNNEIASVYQCPMKCEGDKTFDKPGSCSVCNMDLQPIDINSIDEAEVDEISETSIFNLDSKWNTEEGEEIQGRVYDFSLQSISCGLRTYESLGVFRSQPISVKYPVKLESQNELSDVIRERLRREMTVMTTEEK